MSRKPHILSPLKKSLAKMECIFFDIETQKSYEDETRIEQKFHLGFAIHCQFDNDATIISETRQRLTTQDSFLEFVICKLKKNRVLSIISCNIWFDARNSRILENLINYGFKVKLCYAKGLCNIIKLKYCEYTIQLLNINQFVPGSVRAYGEILGIPKLNIDFDKDDYESIMLYCERDTDIIKLMFRWWLGFIWEHGLGSFGYTLASQAFTAFRHRFMSHEIYIHGDDDYSAFERKSYFGGRTEAFYIGLIPTQETYCVDVNSMYSWAMKGHEYPTKIIGSGNDVPLDTLGDALGEYYCIAYVALDTDKNYYPYRNDSKLCFPVGRFHTCLCHAELELAFENNHIEHVVKVLIYEKADIFTEYVNYFYNLKQKYTIDGDKIFRFMTKLFLNTLYGKFGQKSDEVFLEQESDEIAYLSSHMFDIDTNTNWRKLQIGNLIKIFREGVNEAPNSFPAISSAVTSLARRRLLQYMELAGVGNFYYCDTDSLFVNAVGLSNLSDYIDDTKLGYLSLEKTGTDVIIHGAKDYVWDRHATIKGIPKNAERLSKDDYKMMVFPSFRSDVRKGLDKPYSILKRGKTLKREYDKGIVGGDGKVQPFTINEW